MKWRIIDKTKLAAPGKGSYSSWKPQLSQEAEQQCVYCCIHESRFGGMRNFHVEHYRPQSLFPDLKNDYLNLFYACGICNVFKSDDWPGDLAAGDLTKPGYPNPSEVDYNDFLHVDLSSGEVSGDGIAGRYIVERLHLNRPQVVGLRVLAALFSRIAASQQIIQNLHSQGQIPDQLKDAVIDVLFRTTAILSQYVSAQPYGAKQLR